MRLLLGILLWSLLVAGTAAAQYPRGVVAEDGTATWCTYCPSAYAGLEVMKSRYDATEFNAIRYYSSSTGGGLSTLETDARNNYNGVTGFPTVVFDGVNKVSGGDSGGSTAIASGSAYDPLVQADLSKPSPFRIRVNSVDFTSPTGSIDFDVIVEETVADIGNMKIRSVVLENNVAFGTKTFVDVTRDVLPDVDLTISTLGEVQNVVQSIPISVGWKPADLWVSVFIQDDDDKSISQSASTRPSPAYALRYWAKGARVAISPSNSGAFEFQDFAVYNLGSNPDVITVTLAPGTVPAGWSCAFTDGLNDYTTYVDLSLAPGDHQIFRMKVTPGSAGYLAPKITLSSVNQPGKTREILYSVITDDVDVLIVDDDGADSFEALHASAIAAADRSHGIWSTSLADITAADLANFEVVVWETGMSYPTLTTSDRAALGTYLDAGGRLFLTGQEIGWELNDTGGGAYTWYQQYLHVNYVDDDANLNTVTGVTGDPIGANLSLALTAGMNIYPDYFTPRDASAVACLKYGTGTGTLIGGVRVDTGTYRLVYLGFGYEAINDETKRNLLMARTISWLLTGMTTDVADEVVTDHGLQISTWPNPARGMARFDFRLPSAGDVRLDIFGTDGRIVRTLTNGRREAGLHAVPWDGRDTRGNESPSGIYFYRMRGGAAEAGGKLVLTR
jgi:hypothetical protein